MLVPSTFTGWYRKIMMTSASPSATAKSRVQLRSSRRNCGNDVFSFEGIGSSWGVSCILCSNIYNTPACAPPIGDGSNLPILFAQKANLIPSPQKKQDRSHPENRGTCKV